MNGNEHTADNASDRLDSDPQATAGQDQEQSGEARDVAQAGVGQSDDQADQMAETIAGQPTSPVTGRSTLDPAH